MESKPGKTLFIRNLPFSTTDDSLESIFSEVGPVKQCFVVKDRGEGQKCRGFGYVTFSLRDDAQTACDQVKTLEGRKLHISFADSKHKKKTSRKKRKDDELEEESANDPKEKDKEEKETTTKVQSGQTTRLACTVVVTGFESGTSKDDVNKALGCVKNVLSLTFPVDERQQPTAFIHLQTKLHAYKACKKIKKIKLKGSLLKAVLLTQERKQVPQEKQKISRLIIRNLSFKCTVENLKESFASFGDIIDASIPLKSGGKMFGFGFVQFKDLADANKAILGMNAKPILGRPVAVDWALPKDRYESAVQGSSKDGGEQKTKPIDPDQKGKKRKLPQKEDAEQKVKVRKKDSESEEEESESETEEEGSDDDGSEDMNEDKTDSDAESESETDDNKDESDQDESDDESDASESQTDSEEDDTKVKKKSKLVQKPPRKSDVDQGRTLFIRNLSYDTEDEGLEEFFSSFGEVTFARVVIDKNTEHSKGTAFVQFKKKEDADNCLSASQDPAKEKDFTLDQRKLLLTLALPKEKADNLKQAEQEKAKKDNRNLWLVREGLIRPGTQAAEGLSKEDLIKRTKVEDLKRRKLKNPNIFVSTTRLCVRNLPVAVDDKQLRKVFLKAAKDRTSIITEARVMRDLGQVNAKGVAKSRGYGFVNFTQHEHALQALRSTNNNPEIFGESRRLIVEFSLENSSALNAKQQREERAKAKQMSLQNSKTGSGVFGQVRGKLKRETAVAPPADLDTVKEKQKGPKGLPSHWGPKIRHKPRGPPKAPNKPKDKLTRTKARERKMKKGSDSFLAPERPPKNKKSGQRKDDFEDLVSKYRQKLSKAVQNPSGKVKGKWFQS